MSSAQAHRARAPPVHGRQAQIFTPEMRLTLRRISSPYKEANTIDDFKAVRSSLDISRSLKYYLSMCDREKYGDSTNVVRALNDTLQGRGERTVEQLLAEMDAICGGWKDYDEDRAMLRQRIQDFQHQKALLSQEYTKTSDSQYSYETRYGRKVIGQKLYDQAAKDGFPAGFFRNSFFHRVTLYCLPDAQDCCNSVFDLCTFAVCRINGYVDFRHCYFWGGEFHSCEMRYVNFGESTITNTRFQDSSLKNVSFQLARMKSCSMTDCTLEHLDFLCVTLDGCSFDRVTASDIRYLRTADIIQSGATEEEARHNRETVLSALHPQRPEQTKRPAKRRGGR